MTRAQVLGSLVMLFLFSAMTSLFFIIRGTVKKECAGHAFVFSESLYRRGGGKAGGPWVFSDRCGGHTLMEITTWKTVCSPYSGERARVKRRYIVAISSFFSTMETLDGPYTS